MVVPAKSIHFSHENIVGFLLFYLIHMLLNSSIDFNSLGKLYFSLTFHLFLEKPDEIFQAGIFQPQP